MQVRKGFCLCDWYLEVSISERPQGAASACLCGAIAALWRPGNWLIFARIPLALSLCP